MKKISLFNPRKLRQGGYVALISLLVVAIIVALNVLVGAVEDNWALKLDLSATQWTKLSDQTMEVLRGIDQDVKFVTFDSPDRIVEEVINKYRAQNSRIQVESIDYIKNPLDANKYLKTGERLPAGAVVVASADDSKYKLLTASSFRDTYTNPQTGQSMITGYSIEKQFTSALMYVTAEDTPKVYFLTGHGEITYAQSGALTLLLRDSNYEPEELALTGETTLERGDTLVVLAPTRDLAESERETIKNWLALGGRMLVAADVTVSDISVLPNFSSLLALYGVGFEYGIVVEDFNDTSRWLQYPFWLIPELKEHDITQALRDTPGTRMLMANYVTPIKMPEMPVSGIQTHELLSSSANAYMKTISDQMQPEQTPEDRTGPFVLAAVAQKEDYEDPSRSVRIALVGDMSTVNSATLFASTNNNDFTVSLMDWLVNRQMTVSIRSKSAHTTALNIPDQTSAIVVALLCVVLLPLLALAAGFVMWLRRRHL